MTKFSIIRGLKYTLHITYFSFVRGIESIDEDFTICIMQLIVYQNTAQSSWTTFSPSIPLFFFQRIHICNNTCFLDYVFWFHVGDEMALHPSSISANPVWVAYRTLCPNGQSKRATLYLEFLHKILESSETVNSSFPPFTWTRVCAEN